MSLMEIERFYLQVQMDVRLSRYPMKTNMI